MDEKIRLLFERSDELLTLSREISRQADIAHRRLLRMQTRCTPTRELLREADAVTERLRVAIRQLR